jgi:ADP-ribosyl-[dinitrogen reductase] hydrolase
MDPIRIKECQRRLLATGSREALAKVLEAQLEARKAWGRDIPLSPDLLEYLEMVAEVAAEFYAKNTYGDKKAAYREFVDVAYDALYDNWMVRTDQPQFYTYRTIARTAIGNHKRKKLEDLRLKEIRDRVAGCLVGLACGDAVGTTSEFQKRDKFPPVRDMVGGGVFNLQAGQWTDDTSMALCLADSLLEMDGFCGNDQMERYHRWWKTGYNSSNGKCFDVGTATVQAITNYRNDELKNRNFYGDDNPRSAGNGSLMRLAPIAIFYSNGTVDNLMYNAGDSSKVTHATAECVDSCQYFALLLHKAFTATSKHQLFEVQYNPFTGALTDILSDDNYVKLTRDQVKSTGYVIDSLQAALWCFHTTNSFEDAILLAANLGDDSDTVAAICGQLAGAFYGWDAIPDRWKDKLTRQQHIKDLALKLFAQGPTTLSSFGDYHDTAKSVD